MYANTAIATMNNAIMALDFFEEVEGFVKQCEA